MRQAKGLSEVTLDTVESGGEIRGTDALTYTLYTVRVYMSKDLILYMRYIQSVL